MRHDTEVRPDPTGDQTSCCIPVGALRLIVDNIPVMAWTCNADGCADFFNRHWLGYTGLPESDVLGYGWVSALHPDDRAAVLAHWSRAVRSFKPTEYEFRLRCADGEYRWFLARADPVLNDEGRILKWYGTTTEIEHRQPDGVEVEASAEAYRGILDSVPGLLFTTTPAGELEFVNLPVLLYFGRSLDELRGWMGSDSIHRDDLPSTIKEWSQALETGQPCLFERRFRRFDGTYHWFQFCAVAKYGGNGRICRWFGTLTDIDDLRRAEAELGVLNARLAVASQLAAASQLSAAIAHEVNQPLTAVVANSDACKRWLRAEPPNVERALASLARIARDAKAASDVVKRVRSLFRREPLIKIRLDLNQVVNGVLKLMAGELIAHGIAVDRRLEADLPWVNADRVQIQQVLVNLIRNAVEAMEHVSLERRALSISTFHSASEVVSLVSDVGAGLPHGRDVFEAFYSTKRSGMGMGLAISQSIIEAHSGRIWAEPNRAGRGTTCGFALKCEPAGS